MAPPGAHHRRLQQLVRSVWREPGPCATPSSSQPRRECDRLVTGGVVITVNARREMFADGAVAIAGDSIVGVGRAADLQLEFAPNEVLDVGGGIIHPVRPARPRTSPHAPRPGAPMLALTSVALRASSTVTCTSRSTSAEA